MQLGWGSLTPVVVGEPCWQIKESNETYTSILLKYQVKAKERLYNVNEFLKVRFLKGEASIEDYERTMNEVFNGASEHFDKKGIALGMRGGQVQYLVNDTGDVITFVQEREVWNYNKKKDEISLVFSFADAENDDIRNYNDNHSIRLIHVDKAGNLTFAVYGYMNRGSHEGKVGTAVYYFDSAENHVEEKAFINSRKSGAVTALKEEQLICYNNAQDMLFILADGALHKVDLEARETEILVENLTAEQYAASEDGTYLAYQSNGGLTEANVMTVWDLRAGKSFEIRAAADEFVRPLGFLESDVIYGTGRKKDAGKMTSGEKVQPMYKLEISNGKNEVVKTSQTEKVYVTGIRIENNMVTLNRVKKSGKAYVSIFEDYITSNREQKPCPVSAETYFKEEEGTLEVFLTDENQIENTSPRLMKAKQRLSDKTVTIGIAQTVENRGYYVYGHGKLQGIYEKAGEAIAEADKVRGVVVTSRQTKVWERGNRLLRYNKEGAGAFAVKPGENSLEACVRKILELEGKNIDAAAEMAEGKSAMQLLDEYSGGEAVDLTGCTAEELFYLIGRGTPVIAMTGSSSAILLVGYDDTMITYLNPATGRKPIEYISTVERMVQETQGTFIGYVK